MKIIRIKTASNSPFVTQKELADHLRLSERTLIRLRQDGILAAGECWHRKIPTNRHSHVVYHLENCQKALSSGTVIFESQKNSLNQTNGNS
jgi:hypothetical protein